MEGNENTTLLDVIDQAENVPAADEQDVEPISAEEREDLEAELEAETEAIKRLQDENDESIPLEQALRELGIGVLPSAGDK